MISTVEQLAARIDDLRAARRRVIIGIVGEPGSGKSTVAHSIVQRLDCPSTIVPMDGFHLSNRELSRLDLADRKGAPETFDAAGYVNLLQRLRDGRERVVYAPDYVRDIEESVAGAIAVPEHVPVVVTEGNYLLHTQGSWGAVRPVIDQVWYIDCDPRLRIERLIRRHRQFGKTADEAVAWATGSDERNAHIVRATRAAADVVIDGDKLNATFVNGAPSHHRGP